MATRKQTKQQIWKKRLKWVKTKIVKPGAKITKAASKKGWRWIKHTWKQTRKGEPLMVPAPAVMCVGVVLVIAATMASLISGGQKQTAFAAEGSTSCVLREGVSSMRVQRYWPAVRQWCNHIMEASHDYQIDPHLIAAVMWVESVGNPQAYSHSGAVGLMQVMPRDGLAADFMCPNGPCFADRPSIDELLDPEFNVDYGARLLAGNIARLGTWRDGLRAYGPRDAGYSYADKVLSIYEQVRQ